MTEIEPKPKLRGWQFRRRWLRYSLRTFLVLLSVSCVWLGWLVNRANQQRRVVQWVTELGGSVFYDYEFDEKRNFVRDAKPPGPNWLRGLIGIDYFANVALVSLFGTQVRDLTPLANFTNLEMLSLEGTQVSDLTPLANLTKLERLFLSQTQVSDLTALVKISTLKWLSLSGTPVDDLRPLAKLKRLEIFRLHETQVSKENREMLQRSLPDLFIDLHYLGNTEPK